MKSIEKNEIQTKSRNSKNNMKQKSQTTNLNVADPLVTLSAVMESLKQNDFPTMFWIGISWSSICKLKRLVHRNFETIIDHYLS